MITRMTRLRILGPSGDLPAVLTELQRLGVVHLAQPATSGPLTPRTLSRREQRHRACLERAHADSERALEALDIDRRTVVRAPRSQPLPQAVHLSRRVRRRADALGERRRTLDDERALLLKYQHLFAAVPALHAKAPSSPLVQSYTLVLRTGTPDSLRHLRESLRALVGDAFELFSEPLADGGTLLLLVLRRSNGGVKKSEPTTERIDRLLDEADLEPLTLPSAYAGLTLPEAVVAMQLRLEAIDRESTAVDRERHDLASANASALPAADARIHDALRELDALQQAAVSRRAFVLEGWAPASSVDRLERRLGEALGGRIVVERQSSEDWSAADAPVVLSNPRLFRPFEAVIRLLPLPRYGTIDPTPFVAVFFPTFFGVILGDVGYGLVLALLAAALRFGAPSGSLRRAVAEIAGACALFTILFGVLYGELFGDLGRRWLAFEPIFDRGEALLPFLGLALSLGFVHVVVGLCLGAIGALRADPRASLGKGLSVLMLVVVAVALLAALRILPARFFTPAIVVALVTFPILVVVEGVVAPIELLSTIGNILSYARIMALGTASVVMAVVANRLVGAVGSLLVGVVFGLLFHLVNFVLGVFGPTVHALRLHYVEFFGKFYSPGGLEYRPFRRFTAGENHAHSS